MANREITSTIYPLTGDVVSEAGQQTVTVEGIQTIPVDPATPDAGQILVMNTDGTWHPEDPVVSGTDPVGSPPTENPVQVAGVDNNGLVQELKTDPNGQLQVGSPSLLEALVYLTQEIRALKSVIIALDNTLFPRDFDAPSYSDLTNSETELP